MRKTKIICTIGPATDNPDSIEELIIHGMNIARLNFSHGEHETHSETIKRLKNARKKMKKPLAIMLDTQGPEVRTCGIKRGGLVVSAGETITLTTEDPEEGFNEIKVNYSGFAEDVNEGVTILIDDGAIALKVLRIEGPRLYCLVENSGKIDNRKGINVPDCQLNLPILSNKDQKDIMFGISQDVDYIAASFVRNEADVLTLRHLLDENGGREISIISKIENRQGVDNIDSILAISDGVMVARGDLGVEVSFEDVPFIQKEIIKKSISLSKPAIIATQMLESMIKNPRPTRAEVSDVANAIYESTSAIMLSGETAKGDFPQECINVMERTVIASEEKINYSLRFFTNKETHSISITHAITVAAVTTAYNLEANAIIVLTKSGRTATSISRLRPSIPIVTITPSKKVYNKLAMNWGVIPLLLDMKEDFEDLIHASIEQAKEARIVKDGDLVVIVAGVPVGLAGMTNTIRIDTVGNVIARGIGKCNGIVTGRACVCRSAAEGQMQFQDGDILVVPQTSEEFIPLMKKASALVLGNADEYNHAQTVGQTLDIPVIISVDGAMDIIKDGRTITVDGDEGLIYIGQKDD